MRYVTLLAISDREYIYARRTVFTLYTLGLLTGPQYRSIYDGLKDAQYMGRSYCREEGE